MERELESERWAIFAGGLAPGLKDRVLVVATANEPMAPSPTRVTFSQWVVLGLL